MATINFVGKKFESERDRNAFAFQNKNTLISERRFTIAGPLFGGFFVGMILGIWNSSWGLFWACTIGMPIILNISEASEKKNIEKFADEYEEFLVKTEAKVRDSIVEPYNKRYFSGGQKIEHISDLTNLINHKLKLSLTDEDARFILIQNEKERNIDLFGKEISNLKNKSPKEIAKILIKLAPETNFEYEEDYSSLLEQLCEYLDRKNIEYDIEQIKNELVIEFKLLKANQFEEKLSRNPDKRITVQEIEHLNGFEFEELIGELFRKAGYKVKVTKKSGDQGADLVIEKDGVCTAIQTKKYAGSVGNTAVQEVVAAMKYYDCDKAMVITTGSFTKGAFELASRNGVQLVDKKGLDDLFDSVL